MNIQKRVNRIVKEKGKMKRWHKLVTALACVVVFCTTYALILPAVTKDGISLGHVGTVGAAPYSQPVKEGNVWTLEFMNTAGASLPSTGGPGTSVIWLSGLVLAGLAGAGLLLERRRNKKTA